MKPGGVALTNPNLSGRTKRDILTDAKRSIRPSKKNAVSERDGRIELAAAEIDAAHRERAIARSPAMRRYWCCRIDDALERYNKLRRGEPLPAKPTFAERRASAELFGPILAAAPDPAGQGVTGPPVAHILSGGKN